MTNTRRITVAAVLTLAAAGSSAQDTGRADKPADWRWSSFRFYDRCDASLLSMDSCGDFSAIP